MPADVELFAGTSPSVAPRAMASDNGPAGAAPRGHEPRPRRLAEASTLRLRASGRPTEARLKALMLAGLDGDQQAHAALLHAVRPLLHAFLGRRLHGAQGDLEDLVQETLIALHTRRATFDRSRPFAPWLFAIARRKLVDHFRRNRQHVPVESLAEILRVESFEEASNSAFDVERLLKKLPGKQARVIRAMKLAGLSAVEAAREAGLSVSDVKVSVHRGLRRLSDCAMLGC
jgi:RNA polymerase sigma factor (sigma-70 family)